MPQEIDPGYNDRSHTRREQGLQEAFSDVLHSGAKPFTEKPNTTDAAKPFAADGLPQEPMLRWFRYGHLPQHLQSVSAPFAIVANFIADTQPRSPERTVCLRKLLEAKDCAVRNALPPEE